MNDKLKAKLIAIAKTRINNDLSHDFGHIYRVMKLAVKIAIAEKADLDIIVPAALFHDIFVYKGTARYALEHRESAQFARETLLKLNGYPKEKIDEVVYAIQVCSFSKGITPKLLEAKILQDSDMLESTGAISIMRTFGSSMPMHMVAFYDLNDPFCRNRKPNSRRYSLDLFFTRLLKVDKRMHTEIARKMAAKRTKFLKRFLSEVRQEIDEASA